jgi:hypothetical protein
VTIYYIQLYNNYEVYINIQVYIVVILYREITKIINFLQRNSYKLLIYLYKTENFLVLLKYNSIFIVYREN